MRVAIVRGGVVDTVVVAESAAEFSDPVWADWMAGAVAVELGPDDAVGPGWSYDPDEDPQFAAPDPGDD